MSFSFPFYDRLIPLMFIMITSPISAQDFLNTSWGMSPAEVHAAEPDEIWNKGGISDDGLDIHYFSGTFMQHDAHIIFMFLQNRLVKVRCFFTNEYLNKHKYVRDYYDLKAKLERAYKNEKRLRDGLIELPKNETKIDKPIPKSQFTLKSEYAYGITTVNHQLTKNSFEFHHIIDFISRAYLDEKISNN